MDSRKHLIISMARELAAMSRDRCEGGSDCRCCGAGCDCGCRNECPKFIWRFTAAAIDVIDNPPRQRPHLGKDFRDAEDRAADAREVAERSRRAAQILIAEIGSAGPENSDEAAARAVAEIKRLKGELIGIGKYAAGHHADEESCRWQHADRARRGRSVMDESKLSPTQAWLLLAIRREGPISSMQLKADMAVANKFGAGLDESRIFRDLEELKRGALILDTLGGWVSVKQVEKPKPAKLEQKGFEFV